MSSSAFAPMKQDLSKEIWRVATTLSDEAQKAAIAKCQELGFDTNKGQISLEETLINMGQARDVLIDAVEREKLIQLPLKLQRILLDQTNKTSQSLTALIGGTDSILALEDAVEDLSLSIVQYNLHNLSDEVLGYQKKMNQLKAQETLVRQVHREAEEFTAVRARAAELVREIEGTQQAGQELAKTLQSSSDQISAVLTKVTEQEQKVSALTIQIQQADTNIAQFAANSKTAAADVEAVARKTKVLQQEIEETGNELAELKTAAKQIIEKTGEDCTATIGTLKLESESLRSDAGSQLSSMKEKLEKSVQVSAEELETKANEAISSIEQKSMELEAALGAWTSASDARIAEMAGAQEARLDAQISGFAAERQIQLGAQKEAFEKLVTNLEALEGRIKDSVNRATGYSLFHSFQKRQEALAKSKMYWALGLALAVLLSLGGSFFLVKTLQATPVTGALFYIKLSFSLPLIFAIAFCSVQYGRERRLEEEYAFKSNISISLDSYQKFVEQFIDRSNPTDLAKYTAFIIQSIERIFTSPTERVFDDSSKDRELPEKWLKAARGLFDSAAKLMKR